MALRLAFVALLALPLSAPARGVELVDSVFQVSFRYAGESFRFSETSVPLLPANACYDWYVRVSEPSATLAGVERLVLPVPLPDWGALATNPDDGIEIIENGEVAVTSFTPEVDTEGWFSHGWCVAVGDPLGPHRFEVSVDGMLLAIFDFEVVAPENYAWPALPQPEPHERTVVNSW